MTPATPSRPVLIFGREPALIAALVAVVTQVISAFWVEVSSDRQAWINAVAAAVVGLIIAIVTKDGIVAAVVGLAQATLALAVGFGLNWSTEQQAIAISLLTLVVGAFVRTQVTAPVSAASTPGTGKLF